MQRIIVAMASLLILGGCASNESLKWIEHPTIAAKVMWYKAEGASFQAHGVCHVFSRDNEKGMEELGFELKKCFEGSLPVRERDSDLKKAKLVTAHLYLTEGYEVTRRYRSIIGGARDVVPFGRAFFFERASFCGLVLPTRFYVGDLGYEFKYCVDGYFHDVRGKWHSWAYDKQ